MLKQENNTAIPELSVIIPCFNGKEYIVNCIETISRIKTTKEILIIDDGSSDGSFEFCKEKFTDSNIRVVQKSNEGIAETRNKGLELSSGKYLIFVDQDDVIVPDTVDKAIDIMDNNSFPALYWSTFQKKGNEIKAYGEVYKEGLVERDAIILDLLPSILQTKKSDYFSAICSIWAAVFRSDFIKEHNIRFKKFLNYEDDLLFNFDVLIKAEHVFLIKDIGYYWTVNPKSESHTMRYLEDYVNKASSFYDYLTREYSNVCSDALEIEKIRICLNQKLIVDAIINDCNINSFNHRDIKAVKEKYSQPNYKTAFSSNEIIPRYKSTSILFKTLQNNHFRLACFEAFAFSIYFKIKGYLIN